MQEKGIGLRIQAEQGQVGISNQGRWVGSGNGEWLRKHQSQVILSFFKDLFFMYIYVLFACVSVWGCQTP